MKAILITYDQAHHLKVLDILERSNCRGFTAWEQVQGRGSHTGEPHYGSHAWPSLAMAIITMVEDQYVGTVLGKLRALDEDRPKLGLRAFVWTVDETI